MQRPTACGFLVRGTYGARIMVDFEAVNGTATIATGCGHPREYRIARNAYEFTPEQVAGDRFDDQLHKFLAQELATIEPNLPAAPAFVPGTGATISPVDAQRQPPNRPLQL